MVHTNPGMTYYWRKWARILASPAKGDFFASSRQYLLFLDLDVTESTIAPNIQRRTSRPASHKDALNMRVCSEQPLPHCCEPQQRAYGAGV